ncbi:MAG: hypothetical protein AB8I08_20785 [Sandaracinaceae bacterium]
MTVAYRRALGLLALPLALWFVGPFGHAGLAAAQEETTGSPTAEDARRMFEEGMQAYEQGEFELALERFERSNEIVNSSELVFNIARAAEQLGRHQHALDSYLLYLEVEPEAENRGWVERRIAFLETQIGPDATEPEDTAPADPALADPALADSAPADPALADPDAPVAQASVPEPADPTAAIALGVSGGALLVAGAVLLSVGLVERGEVEGLETVTPWPEVRDRAERAPVFMGVGGALLGVGALALGVSVVLLFAAEGSDDVVADADGVGARF